MLFRSLRTDNGPSEQGAVQTAREAPAKPSQSVAAGGPYAGPDFKDFAAQHGGAKLSEQDVEKLMLSSWNGNGAPRTRTDLSAAINLRLTKSK